MPCQATTSRQLETNQKGRKRLLDRVTLTLGQTPAVFSWKRSERGSATHGCLVPHIEIVRNGRASPEESVYVLFPAR